jgi:hypothetical protein
LGENDQSKKIEETKEISEQQERIVECYHKDAGKLTRKDSSLLEEIRNSSDAKLIKNIVEGMKYIKGASLGYWGVSSSDLNMIGLDRVEADRRAKLDPAFDRELTLAVEKTEEELKDWKEADEADFIQT